MPATDTEQQLREAIVAILSTNATVISLCGGTANIVDRTSPGPAVNLPCLVYEVLEYAEGSGRAELSLTGVADETDAQGKARELAKAAVTALSQPAFAAATYGLQVAPGPPLGLNVAEAGVIEIDGHPNLRQADRILTLLVVE